MFEVLKILITLVVIVLLLNRKIKMGNAMLAGSGVLFLLSGLTAQHLKAAVVTTATSLSTWEIVLALYFVMCLEYQLRVGGIVDGLMETARRRLRSDRALLAIMPAFLGFLPSLGGAVFSAPLVENAGKPYKLSAETKTAINYWFRHVWEYTNPILASLLLASQISNIPLNLLIVNMVWVTVFSIIIGIVFLLLPLKKTNRHVIHPTATSKGGSNGSYYYVCLAAGPVFANFFLVVAMHFPASVSMGLVVLAMAFILRQNLGNIRAMLAHAFDHKLLWGIVSILLFQSVLRQSGTIEEIAMLLNSLAVSKQVIIGTVSFVAGLLTGTTQGFVAIAFPFVAVLAPGDINLAMLAYVLGAAGQMLSPAHLCLLLTLEYFKADFLKTLLPIVLLEAIMVIAACIVVAIY
ncbi:MAG: DUF401 family protein [Sporomusa sp.]